MLEPVYKNKFKQDIERMKKRGKQLKKLHEIIFILINQQILPFKCRDHALRGQYSDYRECHIEPDWLMIYFLEENNIVFVRTGSHADLFG
ncbi:MAG: type II toxin-antitoxin system YafQ family toxin [Gammaproteobacteria bacterium]|jgi:mRNA interferase YafQ